MTDTCVCCGVPVPEGRQVCPRCETWSAAPDAILPDGTFLYLKTNSKPNTGSLQLEIYRMLMSEKPDNIRVIRCPFCQKINRTRRAVNVICGCGAKFYIHNGQWWDRKTGKIIQLYSW